MASALQGMDEARLRRAFLEDAEDLLEKLNHGLLELEKRQDNPALVNEVFRFIHSLKSESALVGFPGLSGLSHRLEDVFDKVRSGGLTLDKALMDGILAGADVIAEMLNRIAGGGDDSGFDIQPLMDKLARLGTLQAAEGTPAGRGTGTAPPPALDAAPARPAEGLSGFERAQLLEARDRGERLYRLVFAVADDDPMKYARAYLVFNNLEMRANVIRTDPDLKDPLDDERAYSRVTILFTTAREEKELERALQVDQVRRLELSNLPFADLAQADGPPDRGPVSVPGEPPEAGRLPTDDPQRGRVERTTVRVDTRKLNDLWQLIGELIINKSRLARLFNRMNGEERLRGDLEHLSDALERITSGLQQAMMETRMVSISVIFTKFPRLVRDLSRKLGKQVDLEILGEETEIDRSVVEALSDPLTHIIRNSLDHGLETADERRRLGKPERGKVIVSAQTQGGKILIEISDDGRGLDLPRIRRKAGLPDSVSDEELVKLIFRPGFSTKESVTDLSGRGVGMDVVSTRIRQELGGDVQVRSVTGRGTTFTIVLPLVMNIVNTLVVRCGDHLYAIPVQGIGETVMLGDQDLRRVDGAGRILYREELVPLVHLEELVGDGPGGEGVEDGYAVILHHRGRHVCLAVHELVEEEELVIKPIDAILNDRRLFSGVSVLGDGRIVYVLDTTSIERNAQQVGRQHGSQNLAGG